MVTEKDLIKALSDLNDDLVYSCVSELLKNGKSRNDIQLYLNMGMKAVGERYETMEYYLGDLICSGLIYDTVLKMPEMQIIRDINAPTVGKVLIGTVTGDVHDLGKSILMSTLTSNGFEVIDLGVDQSIEAFVDAVAEYKPDIIAMSGILTSSLQYITDIIAAIKSDDANKDIKIIIGGNRILEQFLGRTRADAFGEDAMDGLDICLKFIKEKNNAKK